MVCRPKVSTRSGTQISTSTVRCSLRTPNPHYTRCLSLEQVCLSGGRETTLGERAGPQPLKYTLALTEGGRGASIQKARRERHTHTFHFRVVEERGRLRFQKPLRLA